MSISFKQVQETAEHLTDAILQLIGEHLEEPHGFAESLRAKLEVHGVYAFDAIRALHGDARAFSYAQPVWNAMVSELGWLLGALSDEGDEPDDAERNSRRPFDSRRALRHRRLQTREHLLARRGYFATREQLLVAAREVAQIRVRRGIAYVADQSLDHDDLIHNVALAAVERCQRNWCPEKSPLRAYLCNQVGWALADECRLAKSHHQREAKLLANQQLAMKQAIRSDECVPWRSGLTDEALLQHSERRYADAKARLCPAQRAELERGLQPGETRTERERSTYRRAKRGIARYYAAHPLEVE
jgi:hypothetical protein